MQRRKAGAAFNGMSNFVSNPNGAFEVFAAMHNAMTHGANALSELARAKGFENGKHRGFMPTAFEIDLLLARFVFDGQHRPRLAESFRKSFEAGFSLLGVNQGKFKGRTAAVNHKNMMFHDVWVLSLGDDLPDEIQSVNPLWSEFAGLSGVFWLGWPQII